MLPEALERPELVTLTLALLEPRLLHSRDRKAPLETLRLQVPRGPMPLTLALLGTRPEALGQFRRLVLLPPLLPLRLLLLLLRSRPRWPARFRLLTPLGYSR